MKNGAERLVVLNSVARQLSTGSAAGIPSTSSSTRRSGRTERSRSIDRSRPSTTLRGKKLAAGRISHKCAFMISSTRSGGGFARLVSH